MLFGLCCSFDWWVCLMIGLFIYGSVLLRCLICLACLVVWFIYLYCWLVLLFCLFTIVRLVCFACCWTRQLVGWVYCLLVVWICDCLFIWWWLVCLLVRCVVIFTWLVALVTCFVVCCIVYILLGFGLWMLLFWFDGYCVNIVFS